MQVIPVDEVPAPAFGLTERVPPHTGEWHTHARHQLLYGAVGTLELEAGDATWALPPVRAAWIGAGVRHRTRSGRPVELRAIYFDPEFPVPAPTLELGVFAVDELARGMILHAMRWGPERDPADHVANRFFATLLDGARGWSAQLAAFRLPRPISDDLGRATAYIRDDLAGVTAKAAARAGGMSERTLLRRFVAETGGTFRDYLTAARMVRAMDLLLDPRSRVTDVAGDLGYDSLAAFSRAFRAFVGETPRAFRARGAEPAAVYT